MPHVTPLIGIMIGGLVLAFIFGSVVHRLKVPPLIGYLLAGIVVGPFTPGYVADQKLANELAELGVILLMFGVGLHFSVKELLAVRKVAIPGALVQICTALALGMGLSYLMGWPAITGLVFGLALSCASTVVLVRAMQERRLLDTERGRIAVGWLIVEDLAMILALVMIPALAHAGPGGPAIGATLLITLGKMAAFVAVMLIVGRRVVPWLLHAVAHTGSRELFRLAVLAIALGFAAGAAMLFGVSFALGAFFAGMILAESELSQRAAEEILPLRDAFAVLFFVSVGMLFNPAIVLTHGLALFGTIAIIMFGKTLAAFLIVRAFGKSVRTALTIAASLGQIGEFSFILVALGVSLRILPAEGRDLVLAGAIISIMLNPVLFYLVIRREQAVTPAPVPAALEPRRGHVVVIGYGRVGSLVGAGLRGAGEQVTVIETENDITDLALDDRTHVVIGNAASPEVLAQAEIQDARLLFVAIAEPFEAGQIVEQARTINPGLRIIARAHHDSEVTYLTGKGADLAIMGEREIAKRMIEQALAPA